MSADQYANKVLPPFVDLAEKYGICAPICMQIIRPVLHGKLLVSLLSPLHLRNAYPCAVGQSLETG